jgi:hypothetical protein
MELQPPERWQSTPRPSAALTDGHQAITAARVLLDDARDVELDHRGLGIATLPPRNAVRQRTRQWNGETRSNRGTSGQSLRASLLPHAGAAGTSGALDERTMKRTWPANEQSLRTLTREVLDTVEGGILKRALDEGPNPPSKRPALESTTPAMDPFGSTSKSSPMHPNYVYEKKTFSNWELTLADPNAQISEAIDARPTWSAQGEIR